MMPAAVALEGEIIWSVGIDAYTRSFLASADTCFDVGFLGLVIALLLVDVPAALIFTAILNSTLSGGCYLKGLIVFGVYPELDGHSLSEFQTG